MQPAYDATIDLGFSADEFLSHVEQDDSQVSFSWMPYSEGTVVSSSPSAGSSTDARVSIARASSLPRYYQSTRASCVSFMEIDVRYTIRTVDGLLNDTHDVTISNVESKERGSGETLVKSDDVQGTLRANLADGRLSVIALGITKEAGASYGGVSLRAQSASDAALTVAQNLLGRWP